MEDQTLESPVTQLVETFNNQLASDDVLLECLQNLNILAANNSSNLKEAAASVNIDHLFNIVAKFSSESGNRQYVQILNSSCNLLTKILAIMSPIDVLDRYGIHIKNSVDLECEQFHIISLQQILRLAEEDNFSYFMSNPDLIQMAINLLCKGNLKTSSISDKILRKLIALNGNGWLFCDDFINLFHSLLLSHNSVIRFRIYEVFVEYVSKYPEYIEACITSKIFESLMQILVDGNDILSQLNALDMVSKIAVSSSQGLDFIQENGIFRWVGNVFATSDDPMMSFLLPGCIKFFGVLCASNPLEIVPQYKQILLTVFKEINGQDEVMRCLCAETISFICSRSEGLKMLYKETGDPLKNSIKVIAKLASNPCEDDYARKKMLQSLASIFDHDVHDVEVSVICEKLYRHMDQNPIDFLLKLAKKPFEEVRYGCLKLLLNISKYSWVEQDMVLCPGFMEYLLNRNTEGEKEGRELKYKIIRCLSVSATGSDNFGRDFDKLHKYTEEGAFYAGSEVAVTYEQED